MCEGVVLESACEVLFAKRVREVVTVHACWESSARVVSNDGEVQLTFAPKGYPSS